MRIVLAAAAELLLSATAVMAGEEVMASRIGNTTVTTDASGMGSRI